MARDKVWVLKTEYNRVAQKDRKMRAQTERLQWQRQLQEQTNQRLQAELDQKLAAKDQTTHQVQERMREMARILQDENRQMLEQMEREFRTQEENTQRQMNELYGNLETLSRRTEALDGKINDLSNQVSRRFQEMADAVAQEKLRAQLYVNQFSDILRQIRQLHPEKLLPGQVEQDLEPVADFLRVDLGNGDYQAAIGLAQTKIPEAAAMQIRLQLLNREFEVLRAQNQEAIGLLTARVQRLLRPQENICEILVNAVAYEYDGEIMFWSDNVLQNALDNFEETTLRYRRAESAMDLERMRQTLDHFAQVSTHLTDCEALGKEQFRIYGMIGDLAGRIHDSLTRDETWRLLSDQFTGGDVRRTFEMTYADGDEDIATFVLVPNREVSPQGEPGEVQFLIDVNGPRGTQDQNRCALVRRGLLSRLVQDQIDIGEHNSSGGHITSPDQKTFLNQATVQGDKIKDERLAAVREQLQLHSQIQE